jgi:hypothetical protein
LENFTALYDPNHACVAYALLPEHIVGSMLEKKGGAFYTLSDKAYMSIVGRPDHRDDTRPECAALFVDPVKGDRIMYANIGPGNYDYRLCVGEKIRRFRRGDTQICEILAEICLSALQIGSLGVSHTKDQIHDLLRGAIHNGFADGDAVGKFIEALHWPRFDRYMCLSIEKSEASAEFISSDRYICMRVEELLGDACSFITKGKIACVVRLGDRENEDTVSERLAEFFSESTFIIGVSDVFSDAAEITDYYKAAQEAARFGRTACPSNWYHKFTDYAVRHFFRYGMTVLPAVCYCVHEVRRLKAEQEDAKVDFCTTLRVYLEHDRNLLRASEALFIHRTTLFYRLNRIRSLIGQIPSDPARRFRVLLSLELMEFG